MAGGLHRTVSGVHKEGGTLVHAVAGVNKTGGKMVHWNGTAHRIIGAGGSEPGPPVFVAANSRSGTGGTPTDASAASMPAGWAAGDLLLAWFEIAESAGTYSLVGTGWAYLPNSPTLPNKLASSTHAIAWKIATGTESVPILRSTTATQKYHAGIAAYRNAAILNQLHPNETVNQLTHTAPDVAVGINDLVLRIFMEKSSTNTSWSLPTGHTLRTSAFGTGGGACSGALHEKAFATAGQAGTADSTAFTSSAGVTMASIALAGVA